MCDEQAHTDGGTEDSMTNNTAVVDLSRSRRWHARMLVRQLRMFAEGAHGGDSCLRQHLIDSIKHSVKHYIVREERHFRGPDPLVNDILLAPAQTSSRIWFPLPPGETTGGSESVQ